MGDRPVPAQYFLSNDNIIMAGVVSALRLFLLSFLFCVNPQKEGRKAPVIRRSALSTFQLLVVDIH